ncbi:MAG: hypothetical protein HY270_12880 [Deltaproteobacteria bacterium]|nr:hypothetical protein [Deltaproteobacteria bacterium]
MSIKAKRFLAGERRARALAALVLAACTASACGYLNRNEPLEEEVGLLAVLPIQRSTPAGAPVDGEGLRLARGAEDVITAQVYGVLSSSSHWRFVPDLAANDAMRKIDGKSDLANRAVQLGRAVKADAVVCGEVSKFVERVGTEYGATEPASVNFKLQLISVKTGTVLWEEEFNETQQPLTSNLLNAWMFWRAGPHWFAAAELSHLGVESLLQQLDHRVNPAGPWWSL